MPKYPYYSTIPVSPKAQEYIAEQCIGLDLHPMLVYAYAQIVYDDPQTEMLDWRCTDVVVEQARLLATQDYDQTNQGVLRVVLPVPAPRLPAQRLRIAQGPGPALSGPRRDP